MEYSDNELFAMSDRTIIKNIGSYLKAHRLQMNLSQSVIAEKAGLNRSTLVQIENGESITLLSLVQLLRALELLHILKIFETNNIISPIELAKIERKKRQRAGRKNKKQKPESEW